MKLYFIIFMLIFSSLSNAAQLTPAPEVSMARYYLKRVTSVDSIKRTDKDSVSTQIKGFTELGTELLIVYKHSRCEGMAREAMVSNYGFGMRGEGVKDCDERGTDRVTFTVVDACELSFDRQK